MLQNLVLMSLMITILFLSVIVTDTQARQFRLLTPIATEQQSELPPGAVPVETVKQWKRSEIEPMVREVLSKWNTPAMAETLGEEFYDADRLLDTLNTVAQRDAALRLQSIQGIQTVQQYIVPNLDGVGGDMISIVSATFKAQLEFNSPTEGFVRREATNELLLKITTAAPP
jgi:hypothetical protein